MRRSAPGFGAAPAGAPNQYRREHQARPQTEIRRPGNVGPMQPASSHRQTSRQDTPEDELAYPLLSRFYVPFTNRSDSNPTNITTASLMSLRARTRLAPAGHWNVPDECNPSRRLARDRSAAGRHAGSSRRRPVPQDGKRRRLRTDRAL